MDPENRAAISRDGLTIWLNAPFEAVLARIPADGRRPLAADRARMEQLFAARQAAYAQAHLRVDTDAAPADEVAERIVEAVTKRTVEDSMKGRG
jgi:shikimate kinase